jgi:hypothetical protein
VRNQELSNNRLFTWECSKCGDNGEKYDLEKALDDVSDHVHEYSTDCSISDVYIKEFVYVRDINYNQTLRGIWENKDKDPDKCAICDVE